MTTDQISRIIEDLLEASIPIKDYHLTIDKSNGQSSITICRCDKNSLIHMREMSDIFNSYSDDWEVSIRQGKISILIK